MAASSDARFASLDDNEFDILVKKDADKTKQASSIYREYLEENNYVPGDFQAGQTVACNDFG